VNTRAGRVNFNTIAAQLPENAVIARNEYLLSFSAGDYEITVFPDGRAIIRGTVDESEARDLYTRYVGAL
jgi:ArsR family metal-binding transcriptional regulator